MPPSSRRRAEPILFQLLIVVLVGVLAFASKASFKDQKHVDFRDQFDTQLNRDDQPCAPKFCQQMQAVKASSSPRTVTMISSSHNDVANYCEKDQSLKMQGRCCVDPKHNNRIVGLDFSACRIKKLNEAIESVNRSRLAHLEILDIRDNVEMNECGNEAYAGLLNLRVVHKPTLDSHVGQANCACPGQEFYWRTVAASKCSDPIDLKQGVCHKFPSHSFPRTNCTPTSECKPNGPGNFLCECRAGYHGYKCLKQGEFPLVTFTGSLCGATLVFSAFLWHTQRRFVF